MSFSTGNSSQTSEINVTPLIDVLLVLLIIFMIIVPLKPSGLKAVAPQPAPKSAQSIPDPTTIVLQVHSHGGEAPSYAINEQPVEKSDLLARLTGIYVNRQERTMFIKGDPDLQFNTIAEVVGIARQASVNDIGVLTPKMQKGQ